MVDSVPTSTNHYLAEKALSVYPNLVIGNTVYVKGQDVEQAVIYDLSGKIKQHQTAVPSNAIDVRHLPAGVYLLQLDNTVTRIVKQ